MMIELKNIVKKFGDNTVLNDISLSIAEGSVTAFIGPSGAGKSTLLRCLNLLEVPTSGAIEIAGDKLSFEPERKTSQKDIHLIRRHSGMVFQNFQLFPHRTVTENITEGLITVQKWPKQKARERAMELLEKVGLSQKADAWPATLSGGQQQRVAIARALAPSPKILLCDEPTSALDPELSGEVVDVLAQLAKEGTTMIMVTHDLRLASRIAEDVLFIDNGVIVERGTAQEIFRAPQEERTRRFVTTLTHEGHGFSQGAGI